jgi:hypothetical protein
LDSRIRSLRIRKDSDSRISIFKDSFRAIVLRIRKDLLDSWKQVESFENWLDSWSRYEPNLFKSGFVIHDTSLFKSGFVTYKSIRIHGFAKQFHVFTNLLYKSRILIFFTFFQIRLLSKKLIFERTQFDQTPCPILNRSFDQIQSFQ